LQVTGNVMVDRRALGEPRNVVFDEALNWLHAKSMNQPRG